MKQLKTLSGEEARRQARALGLGLDTAFFAINRFGQGIGRSFQASELSFMTEAHRQGFGAMMKHRLGDMVRATTPWINPKPATIRD